MTDRILTSTYSLDSVGKKQGKPIFTEKGTIYETDFIIYNLKTKRAQIRGVITEQMGAFMHGEDVKRMKEMKCTSQKPCIALVTSVILIFIFNRKN